MSRRSKSHPFVRLLFLRFPLRGATIFRRFRFYLYDLTCPRSPSAKHQSTSGSCSQIQPRLEHLRAWLLKKWNTAAFCLVSFRDVRITRGWLTFQPHTSYGSVQNLRYTFHMIANPSV